MPPFERGPLASALGADKYPTAPGATTRGIAASSRPPMSQPWTQVVSGQHRTPATGASSPHSTMLTAAAAGSNNRNNNNSYSVSTTTAAAVPSGPEFSRYPQEQWSRGYRPPEQDRHQLDAILLPPPPPHDYSRDDGSDYNFNSRVWRRPTWDNKPRQNSNVPQGSQQSAVPSPQLDDANSYYQQQPIERTNPRQDETETSISNGNQPAHAAPPVFSKRWADETVDRDSEDEPTQPPSRTDTVVDTTRSYPSPAQPQPIVHPTRQQKETRTTDWAGGETVQQNVVPPHNLQHQNRGVTGMLWRSTPRERLSSQQEEDAVQGGVVYGYGLNDEVAPVPMDLTLQSEQAAATRLYTGTQQIQYSQQLYRVSAAPPPRTRSAVDAMIKGAGDYVEGGGGGRRRRHPLEPNDLWNGEYRDNNIQVPGSNSERRAPRVRQDRPSDSRPQQWSGFESRVENNRGGQGIRDGENMRRGYDGGIDMEHLLTFNSQPESPPSTAMYEAAEAITYPSPLRRNGNQSMTSSQQQNFMVLMAPGGGAFQQQPNGGGHMYPSGSYLYYPPRLLSGSHPQCFESYPVPQLYDLSTQQAGPGVYVSDSIHCPRPDTVPAIVWEPMIQQPPHPIQPPDQMPYGHDCREQRQSAGGRNILHRSPQSEQARTTAFEPAASAGGEAKPKARKTWNTAAATKGSYDDGMISYVSRIRGEKQSRINLQNVRPHHEPHPVVQQDDQRKTVPAAAAVQQQHNNNNRLDHYERRASGRTEASDSIPTSRQHPPRPFHPDSFRRNIAPVLNSRPGQRGRTSICRHFISGKCSFGQCKFLHPEPFEGRRGDETARMPQVPGPSNDRSREDDRREQQQSWRQLNRHLQPDHQKSSPPIQLDSISQGGQLPRHLTGTAFQPSPPAEEGPPTSISQRDDQTTSLAPAEQPEATGVFVVEKGLVTSRGLVDIDDRKKRMRKKKKGKSHALTTAAGTELNSGGGRRKDGVARRKVEVGAEQKLARQQQQQQQQQQQPLAKGTAPEPLAIDEQVGQNKLHRADRSTTVVGVSDVGAEDRAAQARHFQSSLSRTFHGRVSSNSNMAAVDKPLVHSTQVTGGSATTTTLTTGEGSAQPTTARESESTASASQTRIPTTIIISPVSQQQRLPGGGGTRYQKRKSRKIRGGGAAGAGKGPDNQQPSPLSNGQDVLPSSARPPLQQGRIRQRQSWRRRPPTSTQPLIQ